MVPLGMTPVVLTSSSRNGGCVRFVAKKMSFEREQIAKVEATSLTSNTWTVVAVRLDVCEFRSIVVAAAGRSENLPQGMVR